MERVADVHQRLQRGRGRAGLNSADIGWRDIDFLRDAQTDIWLYQANGTEAQTFSVVYVDGEWFKIVLKKNPQMCINVVNGDSKNGARLWLWPDDGTDSCYFKAISCGDGTYKLQSKIGPNQRILDLSNDTAYNGAVVQLWDMHDTPAGRWKFTPVNAGLNTYPLASSGRINAYTSADLSAPTGGYVDAATDLCRILQISGNGKAVQAAYPTRSGEKTAWFALNQFLISSTVQSRGTATANFIVYRRDTGSDTIGEVYKGDTVYILGMSNNSNSIRHQVVYPANGQWKMGFAFSSMRDLRTYITYDGTTGPFNLPINYTSTPAPAPAPTPAPAPVSFPSISSNQYISTYALASSGRINAYSSASLSSPEANRYVDASTDLCRIVAISGNAVQVSYPISNGRRTAWFPLSQFMTSGTVTSCKTSTGRFTVYRRDSGSATIGSVYQNDTVYVLGSSAGRTQLIYPVSGGCWKMGFANAGDVQKFLGIDIPQPEPSPNTSTDIRFPLKGSITRSSSVKTNGYYCDYKASAGTPIYAPANGTVTLRQSYAINYKKLASYGNNLVFTSSDGVYTMTMAHLSSFDSNLPHQPQYTSSLSYPCSASQYSCRTISLGSFQVSQGQVLGYVGSTGNASGPHLHLEVKMNGRAVNPASVLTTWN